MSTNSPNPSSSVDPSAPDAIRTVDRDVASAAHQTPLPASVKFNKQITGMADRAHSKPDLIRGIANVLKAAGANALWIVANESTGDWSKPISLLGNDPEILDLLDSSIQTAMSLVQANRSLILVEPSSLPGYVLLAAPIQSGDLVTDVLIALFQSSNTKSVPFDWTFSMAADAVSKWQMQRFVSSSKHQLSSLSSFVNMAAAMNRTDNQLDAAITLVNELKTATQTDHVTLMLRCGRNGPFKLTAMSGVEFFDRNAATTQTIESTILGIEETPNFWYRPVKTDQNNSPDQNANLRNFCNLFDAAGCAVLPLRDAANHLFGWLLLTMTESQCGNDHTEKHFRQITSLVAGQMETVLRSQRTMTRVCLDNARLTLKKRVVRKVGILLALTVLAMCIPWTYKVPCACELQLTSRRFVAAPYEGLLEKTLVSNGDVVQLGQTLALMDARQLRMELSGLSADRESERKKRDSALARGSVAESQIARSEMARLDSEISIVSTRLDNTEIRSPIDGVIVSGDLDKAQGAPMEMGQNLFEVGPLENMLVEIQIPENEIQYVSVGQEVRFEFDAFPFESFTGSIERIHPRAEIVDSDSVFIAEINLENTSGQLRPGLKGRAKILGDRHPLGWNLFHGAIEKSRRWLIW